MLIKASQPWPREDFPPTAAGMVYTENASLNMLDTVAVDLARVLDAPD